MAPVDDTVTAEHIGFSLLPHVLSPKSYMSSARGTSDGGGPVTRKRAPDREEQGKPRKDARRGRCHLLE